MEVQFVSAARALKNQELMPQSKDLGLERSLTPEDFSNREKQRENDREHDTGNIRRQPRNFK
jgi:hypothetical protein